MALTMALGLTAGGPLLIDVAGGRQIGPDTAYLGALATGDGADFAARLRQGGAWAVFDGGTLAALCGWET